MLTLTLSIMGSHFVGIPTWNMLLYVAVLLCVWGIGCVYCLCAVKLPLDGVQGLDDVKSMIHKLYTSLNIDQHQVGVAVRGGHCSEDILGHQRPQTHHRHSCYRTIDIEPLLYIRIRRSRVDMYVQ